MAKFYRIGSKWLIALLAIVMLVAVGCSSDDNNDNGNNDTNSAPQNVTITLSQTSLGSSGGSVTVSVSASDPDGDALTYTYSVTLGSVSGSGSQVTWQVPANSGTSTLQGSITATVSDGKLSAQAQAGVTVAAAAAQTTKITGTLRMAAGASGNLDNTQVAVYRTIGDWNTYAPAALDAAVGIGLGASATFSLDPIADGTWYLDAWKDIDGSLNWSSGDLVGWVGAGGLSSPSLSAFSLAQGEHKIIDINDMIPIP